MKSPAAESGGVISLKASLVYFVQAVGIPTAKNPLLPVSTHDFVNALCVKLCLGPVNNSFEQSPVRGTD